MYNLIRQKRKTIAIYIQDDLSVLVKVPFHMKQQAIDEFVSKHEEWITRTIHEKKELASQKDWLTKGEILYLGNTLKVEIEESTSVKPGIVITETDFIIVTPNKNDHFLIKKQVETYTKKQALALFTQLTKEYCSQLGCQYERITVRKQKTRWGSCSMRGALSFNIRLMGAPLDVIRYVVLHEVVHLIHFNHSTSFWNTIEGVMPDYKAKQNYLKEHANILDI